jgi:hypothetical protein
MKTRHLPYRCSAVCAFFAFWAVATATLTQAATFTWTTTGAGPFDWNDPTNWSTTDDMTGRDAFPYQAGDVALNVLGGTSGTRVLNLNQTITLGQLTEQGDNSQYNLGTDGSGFVFDTGSTSNAIIQGRGGFTINVPILLNNTVDFSSPDFSRRQNFTGVVSGVGGLNLGARIALTLSGADSNTFSGLTVVNNDGTNAQDPWGLRLSKSADTTAIAGDLQITGNGLVLMANNNQIADTSIVSIASGGIFQLAGFEETIERLNIATGASLDLGTDGLFNTNLLYIDGIQQNAGTYSSTDFAFLTGTGSLVVAIPEPSTYAMIMGLGIGLIVFGYRRRLQSVSE